MPFSIVLLVLAAAFFHALWNTILKSQPDQTVGLFVQLATVSVIGFVGALWYGAPPREVWEYLALGVIIHFAYHCCLIATYRRSDISITYPILRGAAPPFVALGAFVFLDETLPSIAICGILIVSAGIILSARTPQKDRRAILYALATAVCIASYSLIDAQGARLSDSPVQYLAWLMLFDSVLFMPLVLLRRQRRKFTTLAARYWLLGVIGGVFSIVAYGLALYAYTRAPIGMVATLRETSVIFGALLGIMFLGEEKSARRVLYAIIIVIGAALIVV